jgi:hypothetical protein
MRLRPHRRNLVVWSRSACPADRDRVPRSARTRRIRLWIRTGALLAVVGLVRAARAVQPYWRPLLPGVALTAGGILMRGGAGGAILLPGLMLLLSAPLMPGGSKADRMRRSELERELAGYSTPRQRHDLEAILDQYPDDVTCELRDILASQSMTSAETRFPGLGRR